MTLGRFFPSTIRQNESLPLLLDTFGNAAIAYSVRKLREAYTGPCMKVYKATNFSLFTDIGFDSNGYIDESALLSFAAGGTLHFDWYDQTGNGRHATKIASDSDAIRPIIVTAGVVSKINGKVAGHFKNSSRLQFPSITPLSIFIVYNREGARVTEYTIGANSGNGVITGGTGGSITGFGFVSANALRVANSVEDFNQHQGTYIGDSVETVWSDGSNNATAGTSYSDIALDTLGRRDNLALSFWGWHQEIIMYTTNKSVDRVGIENNQKAYFGI